jgi:hypothetical protein
MDSAQAPFSYSSSVPVTSQSSYTVRFFGTRHSSCCQLIQALLKSVMEITGRYKVDFRPPNSLRSVLGFKNRVYHAGFNESKNIVNILTVNSIFVEVDIINGSYIMGKLSPIIYSFFPNVSPGYKIVDNPINLVFLPVNTHSIDKVTVRLTDQDGKLLNLRGQTITIRLHIRGI